MMSKTILALILLEEKLLKPTIHPKILTNN